MGFGLASAAEDGHGRGIAPGQGIGRHGAGGGGPHYGDLLGVRDADRVAFGGFEQHHDASVQAAARPWFH